MEHESLKYPVRGIMTVFEQAESTLFRSQTASFPGFQQVLMGAHNKNQLEIRRQESPGLQSCRETLQYDYPHCV